MNPRDRAARRRSGSPAGAADAPRGSTSRPAKTHAQEAAPAPAAGLPLRHPATIAAALACAISAVLSMTFLIYDTDVWQHLLVGRVVWESHSIPTRQLWSWPTYGTPDVNSSWGFETLLWPFWSAGRVWGLFAWRWLWALATFAILWVVSRRMGARGLIAFVVMAVAALIDRGRSQLRPEMVVGVLLALELLILETRRRGGADRSPWLLAIAWAWINCHLSWHLGLAVIGVYVMDDLLALRLLRGKPGRFPQARARARRLGWILLAVPVVSLLNPFGWRALWQPFEFFFLRRHEAIYTGIAELDRVWWGVNLRNGLPIFVAAWPLLALWRARRRGFDVVETLLCAGFTILGLAVQRFLGLYAIVAAPFLARDLDLWIATRRWPAWSRPPAARGALAALGCIAVGIAEWTNPFRPFGLGIDWHAYPVAACDFVAAHGVRGRAFNPFHLGGYMLFRFWPDRSRLPYMDVHQSGGLAERTRYDRAFLSRDAWEAFAREDRIEWVLAPLGAENQLLDYLDADTSLALVFVDDAAAVYVRRGGPLGAVADSFAYRVLPASRRSIAALGRACAADTVLRRRAEAELLRAARSSSFDATAYSLLANIALLDRRWDTARERLEQALRVSARLPRLHERLGIVALEQGRPRDAIRELERERALAPGARGLELPLGQAHSRLGDLGHARLWYARALARDPADEEARDSLAATAARLERRGRP